MEKTIMLVEDKTKYCWCDDEVAGEPQNSIKDAIADYLEYISDLCDIGDSDHSYLGGVPDIEAVQIGHPCYFKPIVDAEKVINDVRASIDEEHYEYSGCYMERLEYEEIHELGEKLTQAFREWEVKHGRANKFFVVVFTKPYSISDYIDE